MYNATIYHTILRTGHQTVHAQCYTTPDHATYRTPDNRCTMLHYTTPRYVQDTRQYMNNATLHHTTLRTGHQTTDAQCYTIPHYALDRTAGYTSELVSCLYYTMLHYTTLQYRHYTTLCYVQDNRLHTRICSLSKPSSSGEQLFQYTDMQSSLTN